MSDLSNPANLATSMQPPNPPIPSDGSTVSTASVSSSSYPPQSLHNPSSINGYENRSPDDGAANETRSKDAKDSTVPAACLACRSKHLKCNGQNPCSRCLSSSSECVYVASRRGYKGPRRGTAANPNKRQATESLDAGSNVTNCPMLLGAGGVPATASTPMLNSNSHDQSPFYPGESPRSQFYSTPGTPATIHGPSNMQLYKSYCAANGIEASDLPLGSYNSSLSHHTSTPSLGDRCLDSFYYSFHASHPFVLPKDYLLRIAKDGTAESLLAAARWVGSIFIDISAPSRAVLFEEAYRLIYEPQRIKDGFDVQAMMLLIVGLDGNCQQSKARDILGDTEAIAIHLGLNTRAFASHNGRGLPVLEESWRRTWWDLFIIDGMIAGVHRMTNFVLFDMPADVALPCEEHEYMTANIPQPMYLEDLEDREFSGDDREFSSFAYRILCGRNLGKFMRTPPILSPDDENLAKIEALLTNWRLHLPVSKKDALHKDGKLDEMMFQAHMMVNATSILLHQPHSQLDSSPAQDINSCAPHHLIPGGDLFNTHTRHTVSSATEISKMITHRVPLTSHTHFFTCVITLSSIVHLSKWALCFISHDDDDLRQQIRLNIGALNKLSEVWGAADQARSQVKQVAQDIYKVKKQQQQNPNYWLEMGLSQDQMIHAIATDDSIIHDIENSNVIPNLLG